MATGSNVYGRPLPFVVRVDLDAQVCVGVGCGSVWEGLHALCTVVLPCMLPYCTASH
jgi:hypothetical protein